MKKLQLPCGSNYGIGLDGKQVCTGAKLGHGNQLPENKDASVKLRLEKLQIDSQGYDQSGAYWGFDLTTRKHVYCAWGEWGIPFKPVFVFVWSLTRVEAKRDVLEILPNATFYR